MEHSASSVQQLVGKLSALKKEIQKIIIGQDEVLDEILVALLAGGHCLLEGVPGLAKTLMVKTMSQALHLSFRRIQFTPDLMPTDIVGTEILEEDHITGKRFFKFNKGPLFANIVLADEINRTPPKTQSALLEAMQEFEVTYGGQTYPLDRPFFILATQNPIEQAGTYPLPEAQLDRFMMKISMGYPSADVEANILRAERNGASVASATAVLTIEELKAMIETVKTVQVAPVIDDYIVALSGHTRAAAGVRLGVSPRGSLALIRASRAAAAVAGRNFVTPEDVKKLAVAVLSHRIIMKPEAEMSGLTSADVVRQALDAVPVPRRAE